MGNVDRSPLGTRRPCAYRNWGQGPRCDNGKLPRCWGKVLGNWYTEAHKVRVTPGHYGIADLESDSPTARLVPLSFSKEVMVNAGQTLEVTLDVSAI
jgi:hypothetical protein